MLIYQIRFFHSEKFETQVTHWSMNFDDRHKLSSYSHHHITVNIIGAGNVS